MVKYRCVHSSDSNELTSVSGINQSLIMTMAPLLFRVLVRDSFDINQYLIIYHAYIVA